MFSKKDLARSHLLNHTSPILTFHTYFYAHNIHIYMPHTYIHRHAILICLPWLQNIHASYIHNYIPHMLFQLTLTLSFSTVHHSKRRLSFKHTHCPRIKTHTHTHIHWLLIYRLRQYPKNWNKQRVFPEECCISISRLPLGMLLCKFFTETATQNVVKALHCSHLECCITLSWSASLLSRGMLYHSTTTWLSASTISTTLIWVCV